MKRTLIWALFKVAFKCTTSEEEKAMKIYRFCFTFKSNYIVMDSTGSNTVLDNLSHCF